MQVKLTGLLNYAESPVEEAWAKAATTTGLRVGRPEPQRVYRNFQEPVIRRSAKAANISTQYDRWLGGRHERGFDLSYAGSQGTVEGIYLETIARYLDDVSRTHDVVSFSSTQSLIDFSLNFEAGELYAVTDWNNKQGITVQDILKRKKINVPEGMTDTQVITEALRTGRFSYERLFKLFLDELRRR